MCPVDVPMRRRDYARTLFMFASAPKQVKSKAVHPTPMDVQGWPYKFIKSMQFGHIARNTIALLIHAIDAEQSMAMLRRRRN